MSAIIMLKVGDKKVQSTKVTYEDLVILYNQFIDTYGEVPVYSKCDSKQQTIIVHSEVCLGSSSSHGRMSS